MPSTLSGSRLGIKLHRSIFRHLLLIGGLLLVVFPRFSYAGPIQVTIGTGSMSGLYYPTGKAIATIVNQTTGKTGIQVKIEATGGSVFNVNAITMGDLEFGMVQSDRQYQAWNGIKDWQDRGHPKKLRSIGSFHPESVVLVAGDHSGIKALTDLRGKHINIGNIGSGPRGNAIDALQSCGIDWRNEINTEFPSSP